MGIEFAFGPKGTWFLESTTTWKMRNLPEGMANMFYKAECDVSWTTCVAFGENGSYVMAYKKKVGTYSISASGIPTGLSSFLYEKDAKGFLVRDVANLKVTLGPNGSYFATDKKNSSWAGLPDDLITALNGYKNAKGEFKMAFRCVQLGINGNFILISEQNGGTWNVAAYPKLDGYLSGLHAANANRGGMFNSVKGAKYIHLDAMDSSESHYMVVESNNNSHGEIPDDSLPDVQAIINTITIAQPTVAPAPRPFATPALRPAAAPSSRSANRGSRKSLFSAAVGLATGVTKVIIAANGGNTGGDSGGFDFSSLAGGQQQFTPQVDWSTLQSAAQAPIQ